MTVLLVGIGGFVGSVSRYGMGILAKNISMNFPWGTFFINLIGSFLIGLVFQISQQSNLDERITTMIMVGVLGGFTTFSTFSLETLHLFEAGNVIFALLNILLSVSTCVLAAWLGKLVVRT